MSYNKSIAIIHAHPDDEALFTAGVSSHYAELGFDLTLITCTNGSLGRDDRDAKVITQNTTPSGQLLLVQTNSKKLQS